MKYFILLAVCSVSLLSNGCTTMQSRRVVFERHPIAMRVVSTVIDEERLDYTLKFRNVGREILTFEYTVADEPGVPHVDRFGPNSGLIENLYPGAEVEVPNPMGSMAVYVTLGTVTYGKRNKEEVERIYDPEKFVPGVGGDATAGGVFPVDDLSDLDASLP